MVRKLPRWGMVVGCVLLLNAPAGGQTPGPSPSPTPLFSGPGWAPPPAPGLALVQQPPDKEKPKPPVVDFAQLPPPRAEAPAGLNPNMIGDFLGTYYFFPVTVATTTTVPDLGFLVVPGTATKVVRVPLLSRGAFKIGENESPRPQDRLFFSYNYFDGRPGPAHGSDIPQSFIQPFPFGRGQVVPSIVNIPGVPPPSFNLHREVIGFEKTLFHGTASFGLRAPLLHSGGDNTFVDQVAGDLSALFKYAPILNEDTGNVLSTGLVLTLPTGGRILTPEGDIHPTLLQPFVGFIYNWDRFFVQGFSSVVVPTDARDVTLFFNDVGLGCWLYRGDPQRFISALVPTVEAHVTTPLNHRNVTDPIIGTDLVVITGGLHIGLGSRSTLTLGVAAPITGPLPFSVEGIAQFNFRF